MNSLRRPIRLLRDTLLLALAAFSLSTCSGIGGSEFSGGGTGGTGISTGSISGFGSVVLNGTHYHTDNSVSPGFRTKKLLKGKDRSGNGDREVFRVGMVVTVRHSPGDNNATEIDYEPNLVGPIAAMISVPELTIQVLGHTIVMDNADPVPSLAQGNVVEISGFVDNSGRIRATFVEAIHPSPNPGDTFEIAGYISGLDPLGGTFMIGPLPDGSGIKVAVTCTAGALQELPSGPANGMSVRVKTRDPQPGSGGIRADSVTLLVPRTAFPEGALVDLDGLVTRVDRGTGVPLSFNVEGKTVRTEGSTVFLFGTDADLQPNTRVQVRGKEIGGALSAAHVIFLFR
jgi:hypothetical protein